MKKTVFAALALGWAAGLFAETVEISVDLKLDNIDYVAGERIRAVVDVANSSPESISVGYPTLTLSGEEFATSTTARMRSPTI